MLLVSADNLPDANVVTTKFTTVHKNKVSTFPFKKAFEPSSNLCDIDEGETLEDDRPEIKVPLSCNVSLDFKPDSKQFSQFIASVPDKNATVADVKAWLKMWFDATNAFNNDLRVTNFLNAVAMNGYSLHRIQNFGFVEYLLQNDNYNPNGDNNEWLPEHIIVRLAQYVWCAKELNDANQS